MYVTCTQTGERFPVHSQSSEIDDVTFLYMEDKTLIGKLFASEFEFKEKQEQFAKILAKYPNSNLFISMPVTTINAEADDGEDEKMFGFLFKRFECDLSTLAGKRDMNFLLPIFVKIAKALHFLHTEVNICHGDLSAQNVIINPSSNELLLIDITSNLSEYDPYSEPPEQLLLTLQNKEESRAVYGKERDIWCLGLLIYHMVTGGHLFNFPHFSDGGSNSSASWSDHYNYSEDDDDIARAVEQLNLISKYFKLPASVNLTIENTRKEFKKNVIEMFASKSSEQLAKLVFTQLCHTDYNSRPTANAVVNALESCIKVVADGNSNE